MIKILYIIDVLNIGGTENQLVELIRRLNRSNFRPIVCFLRSNAFTENIDLNCEKIYMNVDKLLSIRGLIILWKMSRYIRRESIDIVHTFFIDSNIIGTLAARLGGAKVIISSRREMVYWYNKKILLLFKLLDRITTKYLANSASVKNHVVIKEKIMPSKIDVIYNGIDLYKWNIDKQLCRNNLMSALNIPPCNFIVGIVSNINRQVKRVDIFIESAALVLYKHPHTIFIIIGDGHLKQELVDLTKRLNIEKNVIFLGRRIDIESLIPAFDVGVNSSDSEGFSNAVLEYMAASVPVVATCFGGSSEIVVDGYNGFLVSPGDKYSLAEAINKILFDPLLREKMGARGRELIENKYNMSICIEQIQNYYISLIKSLST